MTYLTATSLSKILLNLAFSRQDEKGSLLDGKGVSIYTVGENQKKRGRAMFNRIQLLIILSLMCIVTSQAQDVEPQDAAVEVEVGQPTVETTAKPFYMAVKTNALYDVIAIPNVGLELYLGKKWSIATNWHYAWWKTDSKSFYWRTYGGDIALRKWFGRRAAEKPLTGHHVGVYGQLLTYDIETGGRGYLGDKWSYAAGVEYGYSLPVAKRMNIDFTLGLGYLSGEYKEYLPMDDCYVWQATKNRNWVGPTKVEVSIVWLIGNGNINKGKGGK